MNGYYCQSLTLIINELCGGHTVTENNVLIQLYCNDYSVLFKFKVCIVLFLSWLELDTRRLVENIPFPK